MNPCVLTAWTLLIMALGAARAADPGVSAEDLFKWGEYDSLIKVLEPASREAGEGLTPPKSLQLAKSLLFLGVAYCATGKSERADEAFSRAIQLDPQVELDRFYVTEEIANRFQSAALRALRKRPLTAFTEPVPPSPVPSPHPGTSASMHPAAALRPIPRRPWVWLGVGAAAAVAVATGYFLAADQGDAPRDAVTSVDLSRNP